MRIGIDCRMYTSAFTGIGRYTYELVATFLKQNFKKKIPDEIFLFFNNPAFKDYSCPPHVTKILADAKHYSFNEQWGFYRKLKKAKLDIVHFPHFNVPFLYRNPYTVTIHDLTLSMFPGQKMTKWYHRLAYNLIIKNAVKRAKTIFTVSNNTKKDIMLFLKIKSEKIHVFHLGVSEIFKQITDKTILEKTLKKFNIRSPFLLYTGVWRSHKNLTRLMEAFKILIKEKGIKDLKLVITGKPDPFYPEVKDAVKELNLENEIIFPGHVTEEELVHLYNSAKFYVFPSLYEGFGLPPLEAMKCGTPVIASNVSSIPEICGEGNALFFNPTSSKDIAEKIYKLYLDPELQHKLKENGLKRVREFDLEKTMQQTYQLIIEQVKNK